MSPYWAAHILNVSSGARPASGTLPIRKCGLGPGGHSITSANSLFSGPCAIVLRTLCTEDFNDANCPRSSPDCFDATGIADWLTPSSCQSESPSHQRIRPAGHCELSDADRRLFGCLAEGQD